MTKETNREDRMNGTTITEPFFYRGTNVILKLAGQQFYLVTETNKFLFFVSDSRAKKFMHHKLF